MRKNILILLAGLGIVAVLVIVLVMRDQGSVVNTTNVNTNTPLANSSVSAGNANVPVTNANSTVVTTTPTANVNGSTNVNVPPANTNGTNTNVTTVTAQFVEYSPAALATAQQGRAVLYFHANWCPVCRVLEPDLRANIGTFPSDVTILKVDFDQETALKQQYGVTYQHTFVQVDASGTERKQWSGGDSKAASVRAEIL